MDMFPMIFDSRKSILEDIMKALRDPTMNSIGIYGLGGVGKTTLAKQVASQAVQEKMFEEVIMVPITRTVDEKQIQGQIASMLGLKLEQSTVAERAGRLHNRLKRKKVLVILDDLWEKLDLNEVGIPFGANHMGCKLLLTSRFLLVLMSMGTERDFLVEALSEEDAWRLFEEKAGPVLENSDFNTIGKQVAQRCLGLPVLIITVAASLSKRPQLPAWNDALSQLKKMINKQMHDIVSFAMKNISYNHLKKTHKQLFLLCGIMGDEATVEQLLQYSWSLGWFSEEAVTVQEARDRLHTLILDLKESCLLLHDVYGIKMHDVVRDVAIFIARKDFNVLVIGAESNIWCKNDEDRRRCTAIVFRDGPTSPRLPSHLDCPLLELFILSGFSSYSSPTIPDTFFEKTNKLKVLDMSQLSFSALPPSLGFLNTLQTLCADNCYGLKDISVVGELKKLQILSFAGSKIEELPSGIGQLSDLRVLNLTGCSQLKVVPAGLIQRLTRLEELCMSKSFDRWETEGLKSSGSLIINASLRELKHLHNLSSLAIKVADANFWPKDLQFEKLERHEIIVGDMWGHPWLDEPEVTRKICVQLSTTNNINHFQQHLVMRLTEGLYLGELKGVKNVIPEIDENGFPCLKYFHIQTDYEIRYIVDTEVRQRMAAFPVLESLHLRNMVKLEKICNGRLVEESFGNLTRLVVEKCDSLKYLFTPSIPMGLVRLQELTVKQCVMAKEIIGTEEETGIETVLFPQLRYLCLEELTDLTTFYSGAKELSSNKSIQPLFNEKVKIPNLERLEISGLDSITTIWHNHLFEENSCFQLMQVTVRDCASLTSIVSLPSKVACLKEVTVLQCDGIKHVFPISMAASLHQLEKLTIEDCEVETIFEEDHVDLEVTFVFSKLDRLYLRRLPKLECFYPREHTIECPVLKEFRVSNCDKISALNFLRDQFQKVISNLEFFSIRGRDIMKMERKYGHLPPNVFATVKRLVIKDFDDKSAAFPSNFLHRFENVTRLALYNCSFKEIFPYEGDGSVGISDDTELRELKLGKLPELESICKQDSPLIPILENLILSLQVWECPRLTNLVPFSVSFRVLTHLKIFKCAVLVYLIQSPTTYMAQLQVLRVSGCEMLEALFAGEKGGESEHDIIFDELRVLELEDLPRLTSFCPHTFNFEFPSLKELTVRQCPNMKTFCGGATSTPKLRRLNLNESLSEVPSEGDLNTAIQQVFVETEHRRLATTLPTTSSSSQIEAGSLIQEKSPKELSEPGKESQSCDHGVNKAGNKAEISEKATDPGNEFEVCENVTEPRKEDKISEIHVKELGDEAEICEDAIINTENQVEVSEPRKEAEICEETNHSQEQTSTASIASQWFVQSSSQSGPRISNNPEVNPSPATETTTSTAAAGSRQKDLSEIIDDDASPDISAMNFSISPNVDKAKKGLPVADKAKGISKRKLKLAEIEAQMQALEAAKKALEEEDEEEE